MQVRCQLHPQAGKKTFPLNSRLGGTQNMTGRFGEGKNPLSESNTGQPGLWPGQYNNYTSPVPNYAKYKNVCLSSLGLLNFSNLHVCTVHK